jgi:hypothetical protein
MGGFDLQGLPLTSLLDHLRRITPSFTYGRITSSMFRRHLEVRWVDRQLVHSKLAGATKGKARTQQNQLGCQFFLLEIAHCFISNFGLWQTKVTDKRHRPDDLALPIRVSAHFTAQVARAAGRGVA